MINKRFATAINCMDGRVQIPVIDYLKHQYGIDYVDMITEPGPEQLLAEGTEHTTLQALRRKLEISIDCHCSNLVVVAGHHDCAGNPVDEAVQLEQILLAVETLRAWSSKIQVRGLYVDGFWKVKEWT